jgi:hypothetical protein
MKILVCGGREYSDKSLLDTILDGYSKRYSEICIIEGGARGADALASAWAESRGMPHMRMRAHWDSYGKSAGHKRNSWMVKYGKPDLVLAFPGGRGTTSMINIARASNVKVIEVSHLTRGG